MTEQTPPDAEIMADMDRRDFNDRVTDVCGLYLNTGDGRFLWQALQLLHEAGQPIPKNLLDKFAAWGEKLQAATTPREVAAALELAGNGKSHIGPKQSAAYIKRWAIASEVQRVQALYKISLTDAIEAVARNRSMKPANVKQKYHETFTAPLSKKVSKKTAPLSAAMNAWRS